MRLFCLKLTLYHHGDKTRIEFSKILVDVDHKILMLSPSSVIL